MYGFGGVVSPLTRSNYGVRMYNRTPPSGITTLANDGFVANSFAVAGGYWCSHICLDAEGPFDAVQLIFANRNATSSDIAGFSVAPGATLNDLTNSTAGGRSSFIQGTFNGGSASVTISAGTDAAPTYKVSDEIACASVTRDAGDATTWSIAGGKLADSYTRPLLHIRVATSTPATTTPVMAAPCNVNATNSPFNTPQPDIYGRIITVRNVAADVNNLSVGAANALLTTGTGGGGYGPFSGIVYMPIVGVIFKYRTRVISVMAVGDSITQGTLPASDVTTWGDMAWSKISTPQISSMTQPFEWARIARAGQASTVYSTYLDQLIAAGIRPTICLIPSISPNDGDVTQSTLNQMVNACLAVGIYPILWTGLPIGTVAPQAAAWVASGGANEAKRVALNAAIRGRTAYNTVPVTNAGWLEIEYASPTELTDRATPNASIPGAYADSIVLHPNHAGDLIMQAQLKAKLLTYAGSYF
jgi:hypothetical protein